MSPFLVYLLMMADDIKTLLCVSGGVCTFVFFVVTATRAFSCKASWTPAKEFDAWMTRLRSFSRAFMVAPLVLFIGVMAPSTKTIAAMIVLPKITSPQAIDTVSKESRDIYELAKKALANLAEDKPAASATK